MYDSYNHYSLVNIAGQEVQIVLAAGRLPYHVILSGLDLADHSAARLRIGLYQHAIANRNGVGQFEAIEPEFADNSAFEDRIRIQLNQIPATSRFYDNTFFQSCIVSRTSYYKKSSLPVPLEG